MCLFVSKLFCDIWTDVSCNKTQLNKCSVASVPNSFRTAATSSGLETSFLSWRNSGCTRGTPMDVVGIKSTTDKLGMEKPKDSIWKGGVTRFFPQSCQNGFLLAPFCWEHLISVQSFPRSGSPSCSWWIRDVQQIVPIPWRPWQIFLHPPGWEGSPAPQGSSSRSWASLSHASPLITSPHTWALTPSGSSSPKELCWGSPSRDVCVCQGLVLVPELKFPGFSVAVMLSPPVCPPHHSSGSSRQEKVPGRENWEFVYPKAMAVNWLQLFLKIFLGFDHPSRRQ